MKYSLGCLIVQSVIYSAVLVWNITYAKYCPRCRGCNSKTEVVFATWDSSLRLGFVQFLFSNVDHWKNAKLIAKSKKSKIGYISCYKDMIC